MPGEDRGDSGGKGDKLWVTMAACVPGDDLGESGGKGDKLLVMVGRPGEALGLSGKDRGLSEPSIGAKLGRLGNGVTSAPAPTPTTPPPPTPSGVNGASAGNGEEEGWRATVLSAGKAGKGENVGDAGEGSDDVGDLERGLSAVEVCDEAGGGEGDAS